MSETPHRITLGREETARFIMYSSYSLRSQRFSITKLANCPYARTIRPPPPETGHTAIYWSIVNHRRETLPHSFHNPLAFAFPIYVWPVPQLVTMNYSPS
jgi:hypothetical protein